MVLISEWSLSEIWLYHIYLWLIQALVVNIKNAALTQTKYIIIWAEGNQSMGRWTRSTASQQVGPYFVMCW